MACRALQRAASGAARRPLLTVAIVVALAVAGGGLALGLRTSAGTDTFLSAGSPAYRATRDEQRRFGSDPVIVLVREPITQLLTTGDLLTLTRLEACLSGQYVREDPTLNALVPVAGHAAYGAPNGPCAQLMRTRAVQVVYGPGTFLNRAVAAVNGQLATLLRGLRAAVSAAQRRATALALARGSGRAAAAAQASAAGRAELAQQLAGLERLVLSAGISGVPSIGDPQFLERIVLASGSGPARPRARLAYLFPDAGSGLIQVRLRASLSDAEQARAIAWIREAVGLPSFRLGSGGGYTVTGVPVVTDALAAEITGSIALLLAVSVLVMALVLAVVFRRAPRLAPLAVALAAAGITFGLAALVGADLTPASLAVLPVLIGLAVDYGIQFQARATAERARLAPPLSAGAAIKRSVGAYGPTVATAAVATAAGFLALLLSPVPMVRGFGLMLVAGIAVAFGCALTLGSALLVLSERWRTAPGLAAASWRGAREIVGAAGRGAREILAPVAGGARRAVGGRGLVGRAGLPHGPGPRWARHAARAGAARLWRAPVPVLAVATVVAAVGWVAGARTPVQSDITRLVPSGMPALRDLRTLERITGVSGEIDVTVRGSDVATPATVAWMVGYEQRLLRRYGYGGARGCAGATLCPALSLPDLFAGTGVASAGGTTGISGSAGGSGLTAARIDALLAAVPPYFSRAVITPDRREATLAFGIRLMPLARQQQVIAQMRSLLHPPAGVSAQLTGLPVLAAQADAALASGPDRLRGMIAALLAVALVLGVALRSVRRALVALVPIVLAAGWASLIVYVTGIALNPLSATLGTLVIAISTEFSVLLSERFGQERAAGHAAPAALARAYGSTGAAVLASGVTAIAGFGVLICSDITMLREFGLVTVIDLTVSLAGVLVILPAVLAVSERTAAPGRVAGAARPAGATVGRRRRGAGVA